MNEFLAMLAHELRNPLAPIRNAVSILQLEASPSPTLRSSRDMIDRQLTQLTRLIDDLLDAGRLTSGKIRIKPERVSFNQVAARAIEVVRPAMDARSQAFDVDVPAARGLWVNADEIRLAQVLQNLLGNASKFTPIGGTIKLSAPRERRTPSGGGGRHTARAFLPRRSTTFLRCFPQGDGVAASRQSGLGIGLALARSIVEMHGGTIAATSPGVGQGSVFHFELPGATMDVPVTPQDGPWILVVDDNRDAADSLADILRMLGFRVRTALRWQGPRSKSPGRTAPEWRFLTLACQARTGHRSCRNCAPCLRVAASSPPPSRATASRTRRPAAPISMVSTHTFRSRSGLSDLKELLARVPLGGLPP